MSIFKFNLHSDGFPVNREPDRDVHFLTHKITNQKHAKKCTSDCVKTANLN